MVINTDYTGSYKSNYHTITTTTPLLIYLGDPNRPMKIAEKYGELYDNEWTDAMGYTYDAMRKLFPSVDHPSIIACLTAPECLYMHTR
jgi:hypothetical protein